MLMINKNKLSVIGHSIGIYIFFIVYGIYSEKISTSSYGGHKYESSLFPLVLQSFGAYLLSYWIMKKQNISRNLADKKQNFLYFTLALCSLISTQLGYFSLNYLSYVTIIIAKSCKLIPIALMNFVIYRKTLSTRKYISIALISASVLSFVCFGSNKKINSQSTGLMGIFVLIGSLVFDGVVNTIQDNVFETYKISSFHMMHYISYYKMIISLPLLFYNRSFNYTLLFVFRTPVIVMDLLLISTFNVLGQMIIFSMLQKHGSLVLTSVNITRKMFSIVASLVIFGHNIGSIEIFSILGVLISILLEATEPKKEKKE